LQLLLCCESDNFYISKTVCLYSRILDEQGIGFDLGNLIVFAALFGFGGAFISLAISKWTAKRLTGARVITSPGIERLKRVSEEYGEEVS